MGPHEVGEGLDSSRGEGIRNSQAFVEWDHGVLSDVAMVGLVRPVTEFGL